MVDEFVFYPNAYEILFPKNADYPKTTTELIERFVLVILCMVFARSAAMAFNRYLDRKFDALNARTAVREIPKGIITPNNALFYCLMMLLLSLFYPAFLYRCKK